MLLEPQKGPVICFLKSKDLELPIGISALIKAMIYLV